MTDLSKVSSEDLTTELLRREEESRLRMSIHLLESKGRKWLEVNPTAMVGSTHQLDIIELYVEDSKIKVKNKIDMIKDLNINLQPSLEV